VCSLCLGGVFTSYSKLRDQKLVLHICMVNPSQMDQKMKSNKFVPGSALEEGEQKTWGNKRNKMDGEFS
jgi:hypothetical protein